MCQRISFKDISLLSVLGKVYGKVLINWIIDVLEWNRVSRCPIKGEDEENSRGSVKVL